MDPLIKQDLRISFGVGAIAGLLLLPTLKNLGLVLPLEMRALVVTGLAIFTPCGYLVAHALSRIWPAMVQFVKFGIVGGLNSMMDLGILNLLISTTGITQGLAYSSFKATSFIISVTNSYLWNKHWTFRSQEKTSAAEFTRFVLVNLGGFAINVGSASLVVNYFGVPAGIDPKLWANIGAMSAVFISLFWNFLGMKFWVFRH